MRVKAIRLLTLASGALIALASIHLYAQSGDEGTVPNASVPAQSDKSIRTANRKLAKDVSHALARTKGLNTPNVTVRARSGAVTLEGAVPDAAQIDVAGQVAKGVSGVTSVKNSLTIRPVGQ